jgi:type II secretory pathway pseudopilin PulG
MTANLGFFGRGTMKRNAFTLIDVLVGAALMTIVFLGILAAFQAGIRVVMQSRAKIGAMALTNEKIEEARNLSFDDVGTVGGLVPGLIVPEENIFRNSFNYTVQTSVFYIDDPFDGLAPADENPNDYKRVKVKCFWSGKVSGQISLTTDVAPKGVESVLGGGTLYLSVFNAQGSPVSLADIHLVNTQVSPQIDAHYLSNVSGELLLPGAPVSIAGYQISVSKGGYSSSRTYGIEEIENPVKPHASVYENRLTEVGFAIDELSAIEVETTGKKELNYPLIAKVSFNLQGAKIIGYDGQGAPVYKYSQALQSDSSGQLTITDLEWDSYIFSVDSSPGGLDLVGIESPFGVEADQPVDLLPKSEISVRLILKAENSFLPTIKDAVSQEPIFAASIRIFNSDLGYDELQPSDNNGQTFFIPLAAATYNLEITADGYSDLTGTVMVSGDTLKTYELNPL